MKKLLVLILALLMLCACEVSENPQDEAEIFELGEGSRVLEGCIFKSADEKYGVQKDGKIILPATYDEFKRVGELGGKMFYALGYKDGTKACFEWNDDGMLIGKGETERTLYDLFDPEGNMLLSFPVDDFVRLDFTHLNVSLEGTLYRYTFSGEGEIIGEDIFEKGKTGEKFYGFDEVVYHYNASGLSGYFGLVDSEGNEVIPTIYTSIEKVFRERLIAKTHTGMVGFSAFNLYDSECNLLCDRYNIIDYCPIGTDEFVGIGQCYYPESQAYAVCRDENGEIMPGGFWFIDENGNALSEHFDIKAVEIDISKENKTATVTDLDGKITEIPIGDYIFKIENSEVSGTNTGNKLIEDVSYLGENGKFGFQKEGSTVTEPIFNEIIPMQDMINGHFCYVGAEREDFSGKYFVGRITDGTRKIIEYRWEKGTYYAEGPNNFYHIFDAENGSLINEMPFENFSFLVPGEWGNSLGCNVLKGVLKGDLYEYTPMESGKWELRTKESGGVYMAAEEDFLRTRYYWSASILLYGAVDSDGRTILEPIYSIIDRTIPGVVLAYDGFGSEYPDDMMVTYIMDKNGNVICDEYDYIKIRHVESGKFVLIASVYDNKGENHFWFIDKEGNKLSESYGGISISDYYDDYGRLRCETAKVYPDSEGGIQKDEYEEIPIEKFVLSL
ncbi:MAG: WG repeat-containing protein [Oscillospiraceae bacterium]|nr:WG repeat-containing protein [Oscillospiraceae bacterium]